MCVNLFLTPSIRVDFDFAEDFLGSFSWAKDVVPTRFS